MSAHGRVIQERPEETAAYEARQRPAPPTPIQTERARRAEAAQAEAAARWDGGVRTYGLAPLMALVEQRLAELKAYLPELEKRRALLPRVVALHQDVLDLGLPRELRLRIERLHARIQSEPTMITNAIPARRLLDDIAAYADFGTEHESPHLLVGWRTCLSWYTAALGDAAVAECTADLEALEAETLSAIKGPTR